MPCNAEICRRFATRQEAIRYLVARGFLCASRGWANGRWAATIELRGLEHDVTIWLRFHEAA